MNFLREVYLKLKKVPYVGKLFISLRDRYVATQLARRDFESAKKVLRDLFPDDTATLSALADFRRSPVFSQRYAFGYSGDYDIMVLYALVRAYQPEIMVETGIASGRSSAAILQAMEDNKKGTLYSIDLPLFYDGAQPELKKKHEGEMEYEGFVPRGSQPGWLVPDTLRPRWKMILGDSKIELPKLLASLPQDVEMFYHDSEHSYDMMNFEFHQVWGKLRKGGIFLSDDITWNTAWAEFVKEKIPDYVFEYRHFGVLRKT